MRVDVDVLCNVTKVFRQNQLFIAFEGFTALCSLPAITMLVYIIVFQVKPLVHVNFKIILGNTYIAIAVYMISHTLANLHTFYYHFFQPDSCNLIITYGMCSIMRWPGYWMIVTISLLHCSLFIERLMATRFTHTYEKCGNALGVWLCCFVWLITIGVNIAAYSVDSIEYSGYNSYCLGVISNLNEVRVRILLVSLLAFDLSATGGEWLLIMKNKRDKVFINYSLSRAYQQGENYLTVRLITPISIIHSCLFTSFLVLHISVRVFIIYNDGPIRYVTCILMSHNMFVFSLTLSLATYINRVYWTKRQKELRDLSICKQDQTAVYFTQFQKQLT